MNEKCKTCYFYSVCRLGLSYCKGVSYIPNEYPKYEIKKD
jgi:hypothetical protein